MPRNTKDLGNSKKVELEKKVESKKTAPKTVTKNEKKSEKKPVSKETHKPQPVKNSKSNSTAPKVDSKKSTPDAKKVTSKNAVATKTEKSTSAKSTINNNVNKTTKTSKADVKKVSVKKVESKKVETKPVSKPSTNKVAVKKSTSTPQSKTTNNEKTKKSTTSKSTVTNKSNSKVVPISDKVSKSNSNKKVEKVETKKASPKTEPKKEVSTEKEKAPKSKIASLADSLFNKIKQFIAGSQKEDDSKKPNKKAKKTLVNQDLTIAGLPEYYDLPYKYNDTVVKILAQTPKRLFIYWDISEKDRKAYIKAFGKDFFEKTYPVLLVHNIDKNYTFEVPVNDFANSWYLDINDSKCQYSIELGRKFKAPVELMENSLEVIKENNIDLRNDYIYITTSNVLEAPNDRILFDKLPTQITFRNVKTMDEYTVDTKEYVNKSSMNKLYNIEDLYKALYKEENPDNIYDLSNPTSGNPTSTFK